MSHRRIVLRIVLAGVCIFGLVAAVSGQVVGVAAGGLATLDFGDVPIGQSRTGTAGACVQNVGAPPNTCDVATTITSVSALGAPFATGQTRRAQAGDFGGTPVSIPTTLASGQQINVDVIFSPTSAGVFTGQLNIVTSNAGTIAFNVRGTGVAPQATCTENATTACLFNERFRVRVRVRRPPSIPNTISATVSSLGTTDSALFFFLIPANLEFLVKIVDGCGLNNRYWVFFAGVTDVEFTLTVDDTLKGGTKVYTNPLFNPANAVTDTAAFATCP